MEGKKRFNNPDNVLVSGVGVDRVNVVKEVERKTITTSDLINQCNTTAATMSNNNPTKALIMNCAYAIRQLVDRLDKYENPQPGPHGAM